MHKVLPTCTFSSWAVTSLRDSLTSELARDKTSDKLALFFYAITTSGWNEIRKSVIKWKRRNSARVVTVYAGTDHAITDPAALEAMQQTGIEVRLMDSYVGVFHPKVIWLHGAKTNIVWVGSNNLTKDGLLHNIEFAVLIRARDVPANLTRWAAAVASGSKALSTSLIQSYKQEREGFEKKRASAKTATFTWSKRHEPVSHQTFAIARGDLILEITPQETRGGNQVQLPKEAAREFLGIENVGDHTTVQLRRKGTADTRSLVVTVFGNNTVRLSINELEYRDRPCVIVFCKRRAGLLEFEIVPENIFPSRYRALISLCRRQTRVGSRRWGIVSQLGQCSPARRIM